MMMMCDKKGTESCSASQSNYTQAVYLKIPRKERADATPMKNVKVKLTTK